MRKFIPITAILLEESGRSETKRGNLLRKVTKLQCLLMAPLLREIRKMLHSVNHILAGIDLASYSSSPGYLGFIENPKMRSDDFVNSIVGDLLE